MRLGTYLLFEGRTPQGAPTKLADFCSAPLAGFYTANGTSVSSLFETETLEPAYEGFFKA